MSNTDEFYKIINNTFSSNHYKELSELQSQITQAYRPIFEFTYEMQRQYKAALAPIQEMVEKMNTAFSSMFQDTLSINNNLQKQIKILQDNLSSLTPALKMVVINQNYVSVPEVLIPDDFAYEEFPVDSTDIPEKAEKSTTSVKNLSFSDALTVIGMLIQILIFTITFIQTNQNSLQVQKNHDELIAVEEDNNRIQEERNRIINNQVEAIEKQAEYLMAIYDEVEKAGSTFQEADSTFSNTDSNPLSPANLSQCIDSCQPTEADEPYDSDTPHKAD